MRKLKYKILMIDIDGTLLGKSRSISAEDKRALAKASDSGVRVSLSTGRSMPGCVSIIDQLSLDGYHIFFDGALVSSPEVGKEVHVQPLGDKVVEQMVEVAHLRGIDLELFSTTEYFVEGETWSTNAHREFFGVEPNIVNFNGLWERERIIKGGLVKTTPEEALKVESFCRQFSDKIHFSLARTPAYPAVEFVNILAPGVSKGRALEAMSLHLGVSLAEVMAVGDGSNDVSLLSAAGLAVAMGNACDEAKAVADYITLDVERSGLAAAIEKFLL